MIIDRSTLSYGQYPYLGDFPVDTELTLTVDDDAERQHVNTAAWYTGGYASLGDAASIAVLTERLAYVTGWTSVDTDTLTPDGGAGTSDYAYTPTTGGNHRVTFTWTWSGGEQWDETFQFWVSGDAGGADGTDGIIALHAYERPEKYHVVYETRSGELIAKQGPS